MKNEELSSALRENKLLEKSLKEYKSSNKELSEKVDQYQWEIFDERSKCEELRAD